jgi:hypothetical protein
MIAQCKELGFKEPVWKEKDNTVKVTFPDVVPFNYNEGISEGLMMNKKRSIDIDS